MSTIAERLQAVCERVAGAERRANRSPGEVKLIVVSKTWPASIVEEVVFAGSLALGENKVQDMMEKSQIMSSEVEWHFIGGLQRNKVRKVIGVSSMIHTVDSLKLAKYMNQVAADLGKRPKVCLQVNLAQEETKGGFLKDELEFEIEEMLGLENLDLRGLMSLPPFFSDPEKVRPWFSELRELKETLVSRYACKLPELSMGMSHDFEIAIEEGATMVRVGSAIFGSRS